MSSFTRGPMCFLPHQKSITLFFLGVAVLLMTLTPSVAGEEKPFVVYEGGNGPGAGKHIVLVSGDEEYRSEEALPQLGKILSKRHGFKCTVLFPIQPETGNVKPDYNKNIPGLEALDTADLMFIFTRFRQLPDDQMEHIDRYLKSGGPVIGIRPATHAFKYPKNSKWHHYSFRYSGPKKAWQSGFGMLVLGETWYDHHGTNHEESTRGIVPDDADDHPITNGIQKNEIWCPVATYAVRVPNQAKVLLRGKVLSGMTPDSPPNKNKNNDPLMPITWIKPYKLPQGKQGTALASTVGTSGDLESAGLRRMYVNSVYHLLNMPVPEKANVELVGDFNPTKFGFDNYKKGRKPSFYEMEE